MASTLCYNRGCGKQYSPRDNPEGSCTYHPGAPFFHDAYKGWTCCDKKCTDFTEFLNITGCSKGQHSNVKPEEPESITGKIGEANNIELPVQDSNAKIDRASLESIIRLARPDFAKAPLTRLKPSVAPALAQDAKSLETVKVQESNTDIAVGESCKNGGCKATYQGESSKSNECLHHPGVPIFHEGMKFWSCCQRKTSDFQSFLNQTGCDYGLHKWKKDSVSYYLNLPALRLSANVLNFFRKAVLLLNVGMIGIKQLLMLLSPFTLRNTIQMHPLLT